MHSIRLMTTTSRHPHRRFPPSAAGAHSISGDSVHSSDRSSRRRPGGFPRLTAAFATLVLVALAVFTLGAVLDSPRFALVVLGLAIPILIAVLTRNANRVRDRVHPSR
jgi:hypothetical protein